MAHIRRYYSIGKAGAFALEIVLEIEKVFTV